MIVSRMIPSAAWTASRVQVPPPTPALALMSSMLASDPALADTYSPILPRSLPWHATHVCVVQQALCL